MTGLDEFKRNFLTSCPYCDSQIAVKAGHRLKFRQYKFIPLNNANERIVYDKIPTYKCKFCKEIFAVDMYLKRTCRLQDIDSKGFFGDGYRVLVQTED